jgi:hypothetical protein
MELTTWIITLVLVTLSFRLLFSALLGTWLPSFHIGSIGIFALRDVRWTSRRSGMKVVVDRIGWTPVGSKSCGKGWFVLKFSRVRLLVPQDFLSRPSPPSTKPTPPPMRARTSSNASLPPSYRRPLRLLRKAVRPILKVLYAWASYLSTLISLFALEVSLTVEFENVATVEGTLSAGIDVYRGSRGEWMRVGGWMGVKGVRVREWNAEDSVVPALEMNEMMLVEANAPLDPAMGISGFVSTRGGCVIGKAIVDVELKFGKGKGAQGIMVRVPELERILVALENIKGEKVPVDEEPSTPTTMNPLLFLRSVSVSLPLLVVSAHYDTPLSILESSPRRSLPRAVEFALTLRGFEGSLVLGGHTNEKGTRIDQEHRNFIGRGRDLGVGARFGWKEIEGRVQIDRSGGESPRLCVLALADCDIQTTYSSTRPRRSQSAPLTWSSPRLGCPLPSPPLSPSSPVPSQISHHLLATTTTTSSYPRSTSVTFEGIPSSRLSTALSGSSTLAHDLNVYSKFDLRLHRLRSEDSHESSGRSRPLESSCEWKRRRGRENASQRGSRIDSIAPGRHQIPSVCHSPRDRFRTEDSTRIGV